MKGIRLTREEIIERFISKHGNKFDYSQVEYKNARLDVKIICPIHGLFNQNPREHIISNHGCPKCGYKEGGTKNSLSQEEIIERFYEVQGNIYNYSIVKYINMFTKIKIICLEHGEFKQTPLNHLQGQGCPKCSKTSWNLLEFYKNHPKGQKLGHLYQILIHNEEETFIKLE